MFKLETFEAVLILKEILSDGITYRWAGKDDVFIDTINGKIVKTKGLERKYRAY